MKNIKILGNASRFCAGAMLIFVAEEDDPHKDPECCRPPLPLQQGRQDGNLDWSSSSPWSSLWSGSWFIFTAKQRPEVDARLVNQVFEAPRCSPATRDYHGRWNGFRGSLHRKVKSLFILFIFRLFVEKEPKALAKRNSKIPNSLLSSRNSPLIILIINSHNFRLASKTTDVNWTKAKDLGDHMGYYKARSNLQTITINSFVYLETGLIQENI